MTFLLNWVFTLVWVIGKADTWFLTTFLSWRPKSQIHTWAKATKALFSAQNHFDGESKSKSWLEGSESSALLFNNVWAITETTRKEMPYLNSLHSSYMTAFNVQLFFENYKIDLHGMHYNSTSILWEGRHKVTE